MLLLFGILALIPLHVANAATCNTVATIINTWSQGQDGSLSLVVPATASTWKIVVTFDKPVTTLSPWQGILVGCVGGTVCTFTNQVFSLNKKFFLTEQRFFKPGLTQKNVFMVIE